MLTENTQLTGFRLGQNLNLSERPAFAGSASVAASGAARGMFSRVSARQKRGKYVLIGAWALVIALVVCAMAVVGIVLEDEYIDLFYWVAASCGGLCLVTAVALMAGSPTSE